MTHFTQRCRERGITETDPDELYMWLTADVATGALDQVMSFDNGRAIYRFFVPEGTFYVVTSSRGRPLTVYSQTMMKQKKLALKKRSKVKRKRRRNHGMW